MTGEYAAELMKLGPSGTPSTPLFAENLAAVRAYLKLHGTVPALRHATALGKGAWDSD
ncbi:hypothetical protein AB0P12_14805 [Streptomyces subrutilus]|uniref:hypothetical protein n=1 Tax=Streptomyces subrutilus TaxID=36818 RepID=UPI00343CB856